jgi:hypothetical protein
MKVEQVPVEAQDESYQQDLGQPRVRRGQQVAQVKASSWPADTVLSAQPR